MKTSVLFLLLLFAAACKQDFSDKIKSELALAKSKESSTFENDNLSKEWKMYRDSALGLDSTKSLANLIEIRVSEELENRTGYIVSLINKNDKWSAFYYGYKYVVPFEGATEAIKPLGKYTLLEPISGWETLLSRLIELGILILPDYRNLNEYQAGTDERIVTVEILTQDHYRFYTYLSPSVRQNKFSEAKKMIEILDIIKNRFSLHAIIESSK